jgi:flagellar biosynthesis/type III secretory pathway protein FliH
MSYLLWHRDGPVRIASRRLVLRAAEVPLLADALALREALQRSHGEQQALVAEEVARGHARGLAQGLEAGRREAAETVADTLTTLATSMAEERARLRAEVGALALQVVRKLLGRFDDDQVLAALAATAANDLLGCHPVALVVHPDLCAPVRERLAAIASNPLGLRCEVRGDPSAARDSCRLETEHGSVDASLQAQLARLEAAWAQGARKEGGP